MLLWFDQEAMVTVHNSNETRQLGIDGFGAVEQSSNEALNSGDTRC